MGLNARHLDIYNLVPAGRLLSVIGQNRINANASTSRAEGFSEGFLASAKSFFNAPLALAA